MSKTNKIPLIYHQTSVLMLDDNIDFLKSLRGTIDVNTPYVIESDPNNALAYLIEHTYQESTLPSLVAEPNFEYHDNLGSVEHFTVDFSKLRANLDTPARFDKISVAFIDKQMPQMDGLDFCRQVREKNLKVKLVLLTGNAGIDQAVKAFNEGIIDAYISKGRNDMDKTIQYYIEREAWQQFVDLGHHTSGLINQMMQPLDNEKFSEFFHEIWRDHQKGEFYLIDSSCSFMFFDQQGAAKLLLVRNDDDFKEAIDFAENVDAPASVLDELRRHNGFPYTQQKHGYVRLEADQWSSALVKFKPIPGTDLHYALIKQGDIKTFSLDRYFAEVWASKHQQVG